MKTLVLVSKCYKRMKKNGRSVFLFHFNGCYRGFVIKRVLLYSKADLKIGESYVIWLSEIEQNKGSLSGEALKIKALNQLKLEF